MEAEYIVQEGVWLRRFLERLGVLTVPGEPVKIFCDSMAAIAYSKDPKYHGKTKHIQMRYHFIRDMVAQKEVIIEHILTRKMLADPLTKPIPKDVFLAHMRMLGLIRA